MNVAELKEALEDYGDHLPVMLTITTEDGDEQELTAFDVDTTQRGGELFVSLNAEV